MKRENMTEELVSEYRRVAYYYYMTGLTQEEIAKKMQMSRQRVNRIVSACVELGIVQIIIPGLEADNLELESSLEQKYQLKEVRIIDNVVKENIFRELGKAAGEYLQSIIKDKDIIGFTRGRTMSALVEHMQPAGHSMDLTVTQLIGNENDGGEGVGVGGVVYRFAEKLQAKPTVLFAPVIVKSKELRESLVEEPYFQETYETMKSCTIAVVGIGNAQNQWKHLVSLYNEKEIEQEQWAKEVVGEVCTHFYDKDGNEVVPPFRDRIISITLEDYKNIPVRMGVAGSDEKIGAIKAAIQGGYINVLVTDLQTAKLLL